MTTIGRATVSITVQPPLFPLTLIKDYRMSDPTPETDDLFTIEALLQAAITEKLPADPTKEDISEAVAAAAAVLRGSGYRRTIPSTADTFNVPTTFDLDD